MAMGLKDDCLSAWANPDRAARAGIHNFSAAIVSIRAAGGSLGKVRDKLAGACEVFAADESEGMNSVVNT